MSNILGANQSPRIPAGFLNAANDPAPGVPLSSPSGSIVQPYGGQLGGILTLNTADALRLSDTVNVGTLYHGTYQYVQFKAGTTAANARGQVVFWDNKETFVVTPDNPGITLNHQVAGITLCVVTKGNYGWIQTGGKATVLFANPLFKTTGAIGDLIVSSNSSFDSNNLLEVQQVSGEVTLDGSNPTPVATGLQTIVGAVASFKSSAALGADPTQLSVDYSAGTLNIYAWKITAANDGTLIASTNNTVVVSYIATGLLTTGLSVTNFKRILGVALEAPVAGALKLVDMRNVVMNIGS